jgi:Ceramidase
MTGATIFNYCERGRDASFWAEPLNALSNGAFVIAAIAALVLIARIKDGSSRTVETAFAIWLAVIGIGSFLFHTFATPWSAMADVVPIGVFMLAYFAYAVRRLLGWPWIAVVVALGVFAASLSFSGTLSIGETWLPVTRAAGRPPLNGSFGYVPALIAILLIGLMLAVKRHPAGSLVLTAGAVFAVSLTARTLDFELCQATAVWGFPRGTHMLWHVLNAITLYLLVRVAIRFGRYCAAKPL